MNIKAAIFMLILFSLPENVLAEPGCRWPFFEGKSIGFIDTNGNRVFGSFRGQW